MAVVQNTKVTIDGHEITIVSASITQSASGTRTSACSDRIRGISGSCSCGFINNNSVAVTVPAGRITCHIYTAGNQVVCTGDNPSSFTLSANGGTATKSWSLPTIIENTVQCDVGKTSRAAYVGVTGNSWSGTSITLSGWSAGGASAYLSSVTASSTAPDSITLRGSGADYGSSSSGYFYGSSDSVTGGGVAITSSRVSSSSSVPSISFTGEATPNCTYRMAGYVRGTDCDGDPDYSSTRYSTVTTSPAVPTVYTTTTGGNVVARISSSTTQGNLSVSVEMRYKSDDGSWSDWETVSTGDPNSNYLGTFTPTGTSGSVEVRYNGIGGTSSTASSTWSMAGGIKNMYGSTTATNAKAERFEKVYGSVNGKAVAFKKVYGSVNGKAKLIYEE